MASAVLPTRWGTFRIIGFERPALGDTAIVLTLGDPALGSPLLRIHSQCFTGEVLKSLRCDCGEQFDLAMRMISGEGCGILIYEHQEGRGIGLMAKLQAYVLQDEGLDTIAANHALGFAADYRDYSLPVAILNDLGIRRVRLLSNNPEKLSALVNAGIEVVEQIPCEIEPSPHALAYLRIKKERMGHTLVLL
jgi:GTP cyclohydrolase II